MQIGAIGHDEAERYWEKVCRSLRDVAAQQGTYHEEQDLVAATLQDLHELLGTGEVFLRNAETGGAPSKKVAELAGWYPYRVNASEEFDHKPSAAHVGWLQNDGKQYWAMFLPRTLYAALEQFARRQNRQLPAMDTLWALLRDRLHGKGLMKCDVEKRKSTTFVRTTKKVRIKHDSREERCIVLAFPLSSLHSGIGGNSGSNDEKGASGAAETGFPPLLLIGDDGGNSGNAEPLSKLPRVPEEDEDATHK